MKLSNNKITLFDPDLDDGDEGKAFTKILTFFN